MNKKTTLLVDNVEQKFGERISRVDSTTGEAVFEVEPENLLDVCQVLRDEEAFSFDTLIDVCGVDYLHYGNVEWQTNEASESGFSRGVAGSDDTELPKEKTRYEPSRRFAVVYHLLSVERNHRLRLRVFPHDEETPIIDSVCPIWSSADWFEREAFDLFGILFDGHPDLRRILTDYGFIGHPFRKDFPLIGNVEVRYDPELGRVVYEPVTIEPRTLVPKVIRHDDRFASFREKGQDDG
jgi:NADH-quinone oxidoreductase subunit C